METKKEFEGILEEIEQEFDRRINTQLKIMAGLGDDIYRYGYGKSLEAYQQGKLFVIDIIRKRMNDGWIPVEEKLPLNAKYKGALCPRYQLNTKYGVTEGWYNPDFESWYVLIWFTTERYIECDIDFERGSYPKIVRCENKVNDKNSIVTAWRPLPEAYLPERNG